jgi:LPXTG-site transpeptidase (sortase) family protein
MRRHKLQNKKTENYSLKHSPKNRSWLRKVVAALLVIAVVILIYPFWPWIYFHLFHPKINGSPYHQAAISRTVSPDNKPGNRLILPDIGIDAQIVEGNDITVIDKTEGVWHDRADTNPAKLGNTVIAGHRFQYKPHKSNYFYSLPQIKYGASIYVVWDKRVYEYQVFNKKTVKPSQVDIRNDDPKIPHELTLYTCTLLNSDLDRYVVSAKLVSPQ